MRQIKLSKSITRRSSHSLERYFQEISKIKLLTQEEEVSLVKRIKEGDPRAAERLVSANLRFVVSVAKQYQHRGLSLPDLISEGNLGLIKAIERFDETKGFKFISYAVWWIRQSILNALNVQGAMIRLPLNKIGALHKIRNAAHSFEQQHEREPSVEELSAMTGLAAQAITSTVTMPNKFCSLDEPLASNPDHSTLGEVLENTEAPSANAYITAQSLKIDLCRVLDRLKPYENNILRMLFGIDTQREFSLNEIGEKYNLTKERIKQIKDSAIHKIRKQIHTRNRNAYGEAALMN